MPLGGQFLLYRHFYRSYPPWNRSNPKLWYFSAWYRFYGFSWTSTIVRNTDFQKSDREVTSSNLRKMNFLKSVDKLKTFQKTCKPPNDIIMRIYKQEISKIFHTATNFFQTDNFELVDNVELFPKFVWKLRNLWKSRKFENKTCAFINAYNWIMESGLRL